MLSGHSPIAQPDPAAGVCAYLFVVGCLEALRRRCSNAEVGRAWITRTAWAIILLEIGALAVLFEALGGKWLAGAQLDKSIFGVFFGSMAAVGTYGWVVHGFAALSKLRSRR